eukprot:GHVS01074535.1.p1 GENE.GHVS01074535.1~~GHVS01074535.1.p1  ORF type:complete len:661 (+),score=67.80 GHVS01074535.1:171-2153(+)
MTKESNPLHFINTYRVSVLHSFPISSSRCSYVLTHLAPIIVLLLSLTAASPSLRDPMSPLGNVRRLNPVCPDNSWVPSASHDRCFKVLEFEDHLLDATPTSDRPHDSSVANTWRAHGDGRTSIGSWADGMRMCVEQGGVLATLHSEQEDRIAHMLSDHIRGSCWIGLRRYLLRRPERGWIWVDQSSSLTDADFMSWGSKLKTGWKLIPPEDKCGEIHNDGWGELPCWGTHSKLHCAVCATESVSLIENLPPQSYLSGFNLSSLWHSPRPVDEVPTPTIPPNTYFPPDRNQGFWTRGSQPTRDQATLAVDSGSDLYWVETESDVRDGFFFDAVAEPSRPPPPQGHRMDTLIPSQEERAFPSSPSSVHTLLSSGTLHVVPQQSDVKQVQSDVSVWAPPSSPLALKEHTATEEAKPLAPMSHVSPATPSNQSSEHNAVLLEVRNEDNKEDVVTAEANPTDDTRIVINSLRGGNSSEGFIDPSLTGQGSQAPEYLWDWISASPYENVPPSPQEEITQEPTPTAVPSVEVAVRQVERQKDEMPLNATEEYWGLNDVREGEYVVSRAELRHVVQLRHWLPVVIAAALTLLGLLLCCAIIGLCCYRKSCCRGKRAIPSKQGTDAGPGMPTRDSETPNASGYAENEEGEVEEREGTSSESIGGATPFL